MRAAVAKRLAAELDDPALPAHAIARLASTLISVVAAIDARGDHHTGDAARRAAERKGERRAAHSRSQGDLSAPCSRPTSHHRLEGVGTGLACACVRAGRRVRFAQYLPPDRAPAQRTRPRGWGYPRHTFLLRVRARAREESGGAPDKARPDTRPPTAPTRSPGLGNPRVRARAPGGGGAESDRVLQAPPPLLHGTTGRCCG